MAKINENNSNKTKNQMNLVNIETGEVFEDVKKIIAEPQYSYFSNFLESQKENKEFVEEYGNFIFKIDSKQALKNNSLITDSDLSKVIYSATYLHYDNYLHFDDGTPISKSDLKELIGVNKNIFYKWYNEMIKRKVIIEDGKYLKMNEKYYIKGKLKKGKEYNRIFIRAIRDIYEENKGKNLKTLGLVMRLLPYIHYKNNILCWNPNEPNKENIKPITVKQLMEACSFEKLNDTKRFMNQISKIRVYDGQPIILFANNDGNMPENNIIFNPRLTYSGKNEDLPVTYSYFVIMANKQKNNAKLKNQKNDENVVENELKRRGIKALRPSPKRWTKPPQKGGHRKR